MSTSFYVRNNDSEVQDSNLSAIQMRQLKSNFEMDTLKCWNCDGHHRYHDCETQIRNIFYFGCGRKGILKPNCSTCARKFSGNALEGVRNPGDTFSQNLFSVIKEKFGLGNILRKSEKLRKLLRPQLYLIHMTIDHISL